MPQEMNVRELEALAGYLEVLTKAIFKAGLSLATVERKWDGFRQAFDGFDPETVAAYDSGKIDELAADEGIVRSKNKIEATVENARVMIDLDREHDGFKHYLESFDGFEAVRKDLTKQFAYVGDASAHWFLASVGEDVSKYGADKGKRRK